MKRIRNFFAALGASLTMSMVALVIVAPVALSACTSMATATFNDKAAITMRTVTTSREVSNALLAARKITPAEHLATEKRLDALVDGVAKARAAYIQNPVVGEAELAARDADAKAVEANLKLKEKS